MEPITFLGARLKYWAWLAVVVFMLLVSRAYAFDSSQAYNTITFSYTDQANVSQVIVLDDNQRSTATSITLTVDAKDGGGRPTHNLDGTCAAYCTQYDVSRIRIHAFNSSGTSIGNMTTETPLKNWGSSSNPGWSTGPGDNLFDWTTVSVTLSASDITGGFAAVAYVRVYLISDEGSYWAGNYGVQYRTPTLQINGSGSNLLYNSEFGVDSTGVRAQGWVTSYGTYGTCGSTSGNSICVTQEPTVTANMWGGGEDPNGGTTSGTSGGYSSVLTTDTADAAASGTDISQSSTPPTTSNEPVSPNTNNANLGFETGTTANWTISNGTGTEKTSSWSSDGEGVQTSKGMANYSPDGQKQWTVVPYGTYMLVIQAGGSSPTFDDAATSLGLTATEVTEIKNYLTGLGGNSTPTNASWAKRTVTLQAGKTYIIAWQYMSTDYVPFNDGSMMILKHTTDPTKVPTLNNETKNYALLGFTNPGTGNYATDSYGSTGWQLATITVPVDGDYELGFASFNLGDTALSPILFVDDLQGETYLNNTAFGPIPPNAGSNAPTTGGGGSTAPTCPNGSTCSDQSFNANVSFTNRATIWETQTGNRVIIEQIGNYNAATVTQNGRMNYTELHVNGSNNTSTVNQTTTSTGVNYIEANITGSSNTTSLTQSGSSGTKGIYLNSTDNTNSITIQQTDTGNHYAEITLSGGNKTVNTVQQGSVGHMVKIELTGGATSINTTQSGGTQQFYSITHNCAQTSCAAITVTQGQ